MNELFQALAKAQGEMEGAKKDSDNPFYHSKYATLSSVWAAIRAPLSKNGLCVTEEFQEDQTGLIIRTILGHSSGQERVSTSFIEKDGKLSEQARGSAITYRRRYALMALVGIAPMDDDAEAAMARQESREDSAKTHRDAPLKVTRQKPRKSIPEPAGDAAGDEIPMFNGPKHAALAARLKAEGIREEDLMESAKFAGLIPAAAKAFRLMSETTAAQFFDDPDIIGIILENWRKQRVIT